MRLSWRCGDYDFQFMIEELAVGAQYKIPYIHVVVNNAYLGLIRQSQRGFDMDYCVQLSFENVNSPGGQGYGVDHVKVAEGLGCKALRVFEPDEILPALEQAKELMVEYQVPIVVEVDPRTGHQRVDGHGARQRHRVRGAGRVGSRRAHRGVCEPRLMRSGRCPGAARSGQVQGHADRGRGRRALAEGIRRRRPDADVVVGAGRRRR